ncbi:InlB B-repeat-containing protein, partial [Candidatus Saccharibacteria bacterium]|nr:InlB B-repeat-containing protein [Candidatus Saccharibacteria bacterium]
MESDRVINGVVGTPLKNGYGITVSRNNSPSSYRFKLALAIPFVLGLLLCTDLLCAPTHAKTSSINITISSETNVVNVTPNATSGVFSKSASNNISITTDNYTGYTFGIKAGTTGENATNLVNGTSVLTSIDSVISEQDFANSANTSYNNKWGYQPSKFNSIANTSFHPSPDANGDILDQTSGANSVANTYTIVLGARADRNATPGSYTNSFIITAVGNPVGYAINYNKNTTDTVVDFPSNASSTTIEETVSISNNDPKRTNYTFKGYCAGTANDSKITNTDGVDSCTGGTEYAKGSAWTLDQTADNTLYLYAMWEANPYYLSLNDQSATSQGTSAVYYRYKVNKFYSNVARTTTINSITVPERTGYAFDGYYTEVDGGGTKYINTDGTFDNNPENLTGNPTTLYAKWNYNDYSISYNLKNGTAGANSPNSGTYATAVTIPEPNKTVTVNGSVGSSGCTNNSASYSASATQTFAGWTSTTLSSTASTASTINGTYSSWNGTTKTTNHYFKNLRSDTDTVTMVANWTRQPITLPQISRTGYTCKWNYNGNTYDPGGSYSPEENSVTSLTFTATSTIKSNLSLKVSFNSNYVSSVKVCKTSGDCSGTNLMGTVTTSGNSVSGLTYNTAYYLYPTYTTGSKLSSWAKDSGAVGTLSSTSAANPTYTIGDGTNAVTLNGTRQTYTVTLDRNCSTTATGSTSTTATYYSTTLAAITVPTCSNATGTRTISGFSKTSSATDATITYPSSQTASGSTCTAANNCKSTNSTSYAFNGWHETSGTGTLVASKDATPALQASISGYTDSSKRWTKTSAATLYAGWTATVGEYSVVTLPTITLTGHTCKWQNVNATSTYYDSGASILPAGNLEVQGVCSVNSYSLTYDYQEDYQYADNEYLDTGYKVNWGRDFKIEETFRYTTTGNRYLIIGNYNSTTANLNIEINTSNQLRLYLAAGNVNTSSTTTVPTNTDISVVFTWNANSKTYNLTATGSGMTTITISGTYNMTGIATNALRTNRDHREAQDTFKPLKVSSLKITDTRNYNSTLSDLPTVAKTGYTYSGWYTTASGGSRITTSSTMPASNTTYYTHYSANNYAISYDLKNGTAGSSAPISGTYASAVTISNPTKTVTINGSVGSTGCANSSSSYTASAAQTFAGWTSSTLSSTTTTASSASGTYSAWNGSTATTNQYFKNLRSDTGTATMVATWTPVSITLPQISRTGYTCKWNYGGNSYNSGASYAPAANSAASLDFTATATANQYNITLNQNNATTNSNPTTIKATYDATSLSALTSKPARVYNITGFTLPSGNNANDATVTYSSTAATATGSVCTSSTNCKYGYAFNGWHETSGTGTLVASNALTPVLSANVSGYTGTGGKWAKTSAATLYAGWDNSDMTLPTITKTGHTCGWTTTSTGATTITYESGYTSFRPTANTVLYGVCTANGYTQTTKIRYENANGTFTNYSVAEEKSVNYGSSYSWSTSQIANFDSTTYQTASVASYTVTGEKTNEITIYRNHITCTKKYRLQNADGTWGSYTTDGSTYALYGGSCSYSKSVTDYKSSASGTNNSGASTSKT